MRLYGHAIPLDDGGFVVTVICPNVGTKDRLLIEIDRIDAVAFAPELPPETVAMLPDDPLRDDDEGAPAEPPREEAMS